MTPNPKVGRAEALRRSMLALIDRGEPHEAHHAWAPFVVVGEGARASVQALPVAQSEAARNALKGKATPKGSDDWIKRALARNKPGIARNLIITIGGVPMPLLDKLRKLAFSDRMRRLAHYTEYFTPLLLVTIGVGLLVAMYVSPPTDELGLEVTLLLFGAALFSLGFGVWSIWRHSRRDPTAPRKTWTVDDLPVENRAAAMRRLMLLFSAAILLLSGFTLYQLLQLEYGSAQRVTVWGPIAPLYDFLGFWPAVLFAPAIGVIGVTAMVKKLRTIKAGMSK